MQDSIKVFKEILNDFDLKGDVKRHFWNKLELFCFGKKFFFLLYYDEFLAFIVNAGE